MASFHDLGLSAKTMAADSPPASSTSIVEIYLSDEMEPASFPLPVLSAPDIGTPTELDPANYPLQVSPVPGGINSTGAAISDSESSCFLLRSALSTRTKYGETGFGKPVSGSFLLNVIESAEAVSTDSRDSESTGSPSTKQVTSTKPVSNVQASTNSSSYESSLLGTTAFSQKISGKALHTDSRSPKAKLSGSAVPVYRTIRDFLMSILVFFELVSPNSTVASSLTPKLSAALKYMNGRSSLIELPAKSSAIGSAVPDLSSTAATSPLAHFIRDAEGWVHMFEGGIEISAS